MRGFLKALLIELTQVAHRIGLQADEPILERDARAIERTVGAGAQGAEPHREDERGDGEGSREAGHDETAAPGLTRCAVAPRVFELLADAIGRRF